MIVLSFLAPLADKDELVLALIMKTLPSVRSMAEKTGVYDFMYHATSKWVHFNPHVLLRMGWGKCDDKSQLGDATRWKFSTEHFSPYYADFNRVYSVFLFRLLCVRLIDEFSEPAAVRRSLEAITSRINGILRWPELVTYEEMNQDGPHVIMRIALRAAYDIEAHGKATPNNWTV